MEQKEWIRLISGGFAATTAPFAVHPNDEKRALEYLEKAKDAGLTVEDVILHARSYLDNVTGFPTDIDDQLVRVRSFFQGKLPS